MNECQNLQQQLDDYLCDKLSDFAKGRIDSHLRQCRECAGDLRAYQMVIGEIRTVSNNLAIEPSFALHYEINRMASEHSQAETRARNYYFPLICFGIAMLCVATLLGVLDHYNKVDVSFTISFTTAFIGTAVLSGGLLQFRRKMKNAK